MTSEVAQSSIVLDMPGLRLLYTLQHKLFLCEVLSYQHVHIDDTIPSLDTKAPLVKHEPATNLHQ